MKHTNKRAWIQWSVVCVCSCALTGHSDSDVSRSSGRGLSVARAQRLKADGRLVAVAQRCPLTAGSLTDAQTINIQHHRIHTGKTGLCVGGEGGGRGRVGRRGVGQLHAEPDSPICVCACVCLQASP